MNIGTGLVKMLNDARVGIVTDESARLLRSLSRPVHYEDGIGPTELYPRRFEADQANRKQLLALPGERRVYSAYDAYGKGDDGEDIDPERAAKLFAGMIVPKLLPLKNINQKGLVNGSVGRVVDFMTPGQARTYAESKDRWSIVTSIKEPKSPNKTEVSTVDTRVPGRATQSAWSSEFYEQMEWPLVQFTDGQCVLMGPTNFTVETREGTMEIQRLQVHKSQGQTLERVKISLHRTFEKGQAYVALSRCTSLETLEVYGFDRERSVQAHPRVQQWVKTLTTLNRFISPASGSSVSPGTQSRQEI
ncbi:PIF1 domain-containing protein [Rhizoctonia solani AG-1 IA]|uniref:PIF1 domain-containing protein n=1 Tax=Thanatephorus cucumeris (strain AG1-IA) TaxID=983506 RepID=L8WS88_THACA|nr:PIF1 domain-containing protein [Rhizoctonia solani AG-1 IA]